MKGFWAGLLTAMLATVLGGIILWYGTDWAQSWKASRAQVLRYQSGAPGGTIVVSQKLLGSMMKLEPGDVISTVRFENKGSEELDNLEIILKSGSRIKDAGVLGASPSDASEPEISLKDNNILISYKLLRRGEGATVWVVNNDVYGIKVRSNRKGLALDEVPPWRSYEGGEGLPTWILFIIAIVSLILGLVLSEAGNRSVLRKIGFDPDEITKAYADAIAKKKN